GAAGNGTLPVQVIRTEVPGGAGSLEPRALGAFEIWTSGDDTTTGVGAVAIGEQCPAGTVIINNAAWETLHAIDNETAGEDFRFRDNVPFFQRTSLRYRIYGTNLSFLAGEPSRPFFYETNNGSLFALDKQPVTAPSLSQQQVHVAQFSTFHHPLVKELRRRFQVGGPALLMNRLTEALP